MMMILRSGLLASLVLGGAAVLYAHTIDVPADYAAIQDAIDASAPGDTVVVQPGIYEEVVDFRGKAILLSSSDPKDPDVVAATIIDVSAVACGDTCSVVLFVSGERADSILCGFTLRGGSATRCSGLQERFSTAGGGIYCASSSPRVERCVIRDNTTRGIGKGGGVCSRYGGGPTLVACTIESNYGTKGGGIYVLSAHVTAVGCSVTSNGAGSHGSGAYAMNGHLALIQCDIRNNSGIAEGGGVYVIDSWLNISQSTIAGNSTDNTGGGIYSRGTNTVVTNCTIAGNIALRGGGGFYVYSDTPVSLLTNCILWDNVPNSISRADSTDMVRVTYSDIQDGWSGEGNIDSDPLFCDVSCGLLTDLGLAAGSPCLGSGQGGSDMGAWPQLCDQPAGHDPGVLEVPADYPSIQSALDAACEYDTILVAPGVYSERGVTVPSIPLMIRSWDPLDPDLVASTVIHGCGADAVTFAPFREKEITTLAGFAVTGGGTGITCIAVSPVIEHCIIEENLSDRVGGGFFISNSNARIDQCVIRANSASVTGGGMDCLDYGSPLISRCEIVDNRAHFDGAGINCDFYSSPTLVDCLIEGNTNWGGCGGGIRCSMYCSPRLTNCILRDNYAEEYGAGLYAGGDCTPSLFGCLIVGNRTPCRGGGLVLPTSINSIVRSCTISGNEAASGAGVVCHVDHLPAPILENCIVWGNSVDQISNLGEFELDVRFSDVQGGWPGEGNIDADPRFASFHGFTHLLGPNSPCIDAGDPAVEDAISDWYPGWPPWYPNAARSDMGAYGGTSNGNWIP
jgi:hypothetical protein